MHNQKFTEKICLSPAWQAVAEIPLLLGAEYEREIETEISERLNKLSIPLSNQKQVYRAVMKVVYGALEKIQVQQNLDSQNFPALMTVRVCFQANHATAVKAEDLAVDAAPGCWGFFLVESTAHADEASGSQMHIVDVFIYQE